MRQGLIPGKNVDKLDVEAGLTELEEAGYTEAKTKFVIEYALTRWTRGEEDQALRGATDSAFHGVPLTVWYRVLGAAMAAVATTES